MIKDYFASASKARVRITKEQAKRIAAMYRDLSKEIAQEIVDLQKKSNVSSILRSQYLGDLSQQIQQELNRLGREQESLIRSNMHSMASAVVDSTRTFLNKLGFGHAGVTVNSSYSHIPTSVVNEVASGRLYEGRWNLSSAIWKNTAKQRRDIDMVVAKGIAGQKSTLDIAKDLEKYVNPAARKDWKWSKVYPGTAKVIDYNAQRLARTMISHAYEDALVRTTKDNPFVECYEWLTSNGDRVCPICREREEDFHGVIIDGVQMLGCYYADDLPLDHPNGMCTVSPYISASYDEIGDRLAGWVNGKADSELDRFANSLGYNF